MLQSSTPPGTAPLYIRSGHLRVDRGAVRVAVDCPPLARHCRGALELRTLDGARLGAADVDLAGGEARRIRIAVSPTTRSANGRVMFGDGEPMATKLVKVHGR
jgi:hypothetical protein